MGYVSGRFVRSVLDLVGRGFGQEVLDRVQAGVLAERRDDFDSIPLHVGEELVSRLELVLWEPAVERIYEELATGALARNPTLVQPRDLFGTVQRLRGFIEAPFVDVELVVELEKQPTGFSCLFGVVGRPRAARLVAKLGLGAIVAAEKFAMEAKGSLSIKNEMLGDRSRITVGYESFRASEEPPPLIAHRERGRGSSRPPRSSPLSREVESILSRAPRSISSPNLTAVDPTHQPSSGTFATAAPGKPTHNEAANSQQKASLAPPLAPPEALSTSTRAPKSDKKR